MLVRVHSRALMLLGFLEETISRVSPEHNSEILELMKHLR